MYQQFGGKPFTILLPKEIPYRNKSDIRVGRSRGYQSSRRLKTENLAVFEASPCPREDNKVASGTHHPASIRVYSKI